MRVGITGHQKRPGIEWPWVADAISSALAKLPPPLIGFSSLAEGADQVFADAVLALGGKLHAILPCPNYHSLFKGEAKDHYEKLVSRAEILELAAADNDARSFENAGKYIVDNVEILFAVWDGKAPLDRGGTGQIVDYALKLNRRMLQFEPSKRATRWF